ncbi:MAG: CAP domain-containing protein [Planctomycetaceae bacterium]|nr:CAP domain-containing protein [Planctomycetaceae bacterium]
MILSIAAAAFALLAVTEAEAQQAKARTPQAQQAAKAKAVNVSYEKFVFCGSVHLFDRAGQAFEKINEFRRQNGRKALSWSDPSGCEANNVLQAKYGMGHHGHGFSHSGECAATSNYADNPTRAVEQWINSSPHRAILLKDSVESGSIAVTDRYATFQVFRSKTE